MSLGDLTMVPAAGLRFARLSVISVIRNQVPGVIVECGVWRGGCSIAMLDAQRHEFGRVERPVHLFDSFAGLPPVEEIDGDAARLWQADTGSPTYYDNCRASRAEVEAALASRGFVDGEFVIHEGWFAETLDEPLGFDQIALLRLDCDWYRPTALCLKKLTPLMSSGGTLIFDDYFAWEGCRKAVDEVFPAVSVLHDGDGPDGSLAFVRMAL